MNFLIFGSIAYLLGSIPSAVWIGRSWYGIDVREHGSKNSGATNTFRILGKNAGVFVLIIDVFKGLLAILLPSILSHSIFTGKLVLEGENLIHVQLPLLATYYPSSLDSRGGKEWPLLWGSLLAFTLPRQPFVYWYFYWFF
jgi:acyl phosphate:glycerol-3-phosphate acyltransferase